MGTNGIEIGARSATAAVTAEAASHTGATPAIHSADGSKACWVCGSPAFTVIEASERMFGLGGHFEYHECHGCGTLQLVNPPADLADYYPSWHYSSAAPPEVHAGWVTRWASARRVRFAGRNLGLARRLYRGSVPHWFVWLPPNARTSSAAILDVGCGAGEWLADLARAGFTNLRGIDPNISADVRKSSYTIDRCHLGDIEGTFDLIAFHHSLEHIADPLAELELAVERLAPGGHIVVRIPLADSDACQVYRTHWVQLDAPRHLNIFTTAAIRRLADRAGLRVMNVYRDSTGFQDWGSRLYQARKPLCTRARTPFEQAHRHFSAHELAMFEERAKALNSTNRGDQGVFMLERRKPVVGDGGSNGVSDGDTEPAVNLCDAPAPSDHQPFSQ
jgi:SAM-dependent methyltransferase